MSGVWQTLEETNFSVVKYGRSFVTIYARRKKLNPNDCCFLYKMSTLVTRQYEKVNCSDKNKQPKIWEVRKYWINLSQVACDENVMKFVIHSRVTDYFVSEFTLLLEQAFKDRECTTRNTICLLQLRISNSSKNKLLSEFNE